MDTPPPRRAVNGGFTPSISAHGRWVAFLTETHLRLTARWRSRCATWTASGRSTPRAPTAPRRARGRRLQAAGDLGQRSLCRLRQQGEEPESDRQGRRRRHLRPRPEDEPHAARLARPRASTGAAGNGDSSNPSISADGRYVAFESYASNLAPADNSTTPDVFVRDMRSGRVFLASRASNDGPAANAPSANPSISADGRYVAFDSRGSNLYPRTRCTRPASSATSCCPSCRLQPPHPSAVGRCSAAGLVGQRRSPRAHPDPPFA